MTDTCFSNGCHAFLISSTVVSQIYNCYNNVDVDVESKCWDIGDVEYKCLGHTGCRM